MLSSESVIDKCPAWSSVVRGALLCVHSYSPSANASGRPALSAYGGYLPRKNQGTRNYLPANGADCQYLVL